jgi:hypothetical protein
LFIKELSDGQRLRAKVSLKMHALIRQFGQGFMDKAAAAPECDGNLPNGPTFRPKDLESGRANRNGFAAHSEALGFV